MQNKRNRKIGVRWLALLLIFSMGCTMMQGIWPFKVSQTPQPEVSANPEIVETGEIMAVTNQTQAEGDDDGDGFTIVLSEGASTPQEITPIEPVEGEALTQDEIDVILARLPEMEMQADDQVEFKLPPESLPVPKTGETIEQVFPPEDVISPVVVAEGPLEVLRYAPEGEISVAPFISVTFNQPMVPLATLEQLSEKDVPVQVSPELPGSWRWVGTKTLAFYYESDQIDRLPKATEYTVIVPAGTESVIGGELAEDVSWTFTTPAPVLVSSYPYSGEPQGLEPLFFAAFDQQIDPDAVLERIRATADGKEFTVRLATEEEVKAEETLSYSLENTPEGRWLAFRAEEPLPKDSEIQVTFQAGMPSAEGELTTPVDQSFSFRTYAPLEVIDQGCSWGGDECYPLQPLYISFNNPLDVEAYTEDMITIDPPIAGAMVNVVGNTITISGATVGSTTYYVTVDESIRDVFGQTLGKDKKLTFKVGKAQPSLIGPTTALVTVDPYAAKPGLSVFSITYEKLEVQIYQVEPGDWSAFKKYLQDFAYTDQAGSPPGQLVFSEKIEVNGDSGELVETVIDLSEWMTGDFGHFIVIAKPVKGLLEDENYWETLQWWVQVTQIGLDAFVDSDEMVVWTTALKDGQPLADVQIGFNGKKASQSSDENGIARFALPSDGISYLTATQGEDVAILPQSVYAWDESAWMPYPVIDSLRWHVFDDRTMYKPGETVHLKGWLRLIDMDVLGDVALPGNAITLVRYSVIDPQGNEIAAGETPVDELGGFDLNFEISENANLGYASIYLSASGDVVDISGLDMYHGFQIQEFRRPEFEVQSRIESKGPFFTGDLAISAVTANYYAGGALPNAEVTWNVSSQETNYQPPNWPEFSFGQWQPWWWYDWYGDGGGTYQSFYGRTDASGTHYLQMDFEGSGVTRPQSVTAEAVVMDVNRQAWADTTTLLVHPASIYVGMRSERYFVEKGTPIAVDLIAVNIDGIIAAGYSIVATAERMEWNYEGGNWQEVAADSQSCELVSTDKSLTCSFETKLGGKYQITAIVTDDEGRQNQSRMVRWVSGGSIAPARGVQQETVTLIPDQETYQPGDTAQILVQSPFGPAEGLLTVSRGGILYTESFSMEEDSLMLEIPIEEAYIPNLVVQVDLAGSAPRLDDAGEVVADAEPRPAFATAQLTLNVPPLDRKLQLTVEAAETELAPGEKTTLEIELLDAAGEPVENASLAVVVVDEAVLALSNYALADPISTFYFTRTAGYSSRYGRSSIVLVNPQTLIDTSREVMATQGMGGGMNGMEESEGMVMEMAAEAPAAADMVKEVNGESASDVSEIMVRSNFDPLALFSPDVRTDAEGKAEIEVTLPDNLTRYRIMVVAVDDSGKLFGSAETNLTARLPLMVRASAPRFLNFGDQFDLPVILQNQTDEDMMVEVVIESLNLTLTDGQGKRVEVPANDRVEVRFPAETVLAGNAHLMIAAVSGDTSDAAQISLPVYTPATSEAFAVYGVVDDGAIAQPLEKPEDVFAEYGGLEITTSSTALQALTDAVLYLTTYPFDSSEQMASRILGIAALSEVLAAFEADGLPSPEEMQAVIMRDIERLQGLQNYDGGFAYWRHGDDSIPFHTVHVAHALQRAREMGYEVPEAMWTGALTYITYIEDYYPAWYSQQARWTISAYALYVRDRMGDADPQKAVKLLEDAGVEGISLDGLAFIWQVLVNAGGYESELEAIRTHVNNRAVETAGAANFTTEYSDSDYVLLHSNRRTDALLLDALINDDPESDLIPKVVNGLMAHRTRGHWGNTQENVFVLLALHRYFATYEAETPDFVARIWLGDTYAGESEFSGYSTDSAEIDIPMDYLLESMTEDELQDLVISKEGDGRLYYRLGLRYAPTDLKLPPQDMGFVVQRVYEAVDDPEDVYLDEDGIWHVKAGARVRVRITLVADNRRYHVALVDPLPAGLEIINPALAVSESLPTDPNDPEPGWWWWNWYQHQNLRDERAEAFTALLWEGVYEYTYVARATTPGRFIVPPSKAEEMYSPEVFGRSAGDVVIVE